jgi:dienelactone hydrolase
MSINKLLLGKVLVFILLLSIVIFADSYKLLKPRRAEIISSDGVVIVGSYYPVHNPNSPAVILVHMLGRNRGDWNEYARYLQKEEIAVLSIDLRGHGESTNNKTLNWRFFTAGQYQQMVEDLEPVYHYLVDIYQVNPKKIGLIGINLGANIAFNYAARKEDIASLALTYIGIVLYMLFVRKMIKMPV